MKRICDKCKNLYQNESGTIENCWRYIETRRMQVIRMDKNYVDARLNAEKNHCKDFEFIGQHKWDKIKDGINF